MVSDGAAGFIGSNLAEALLVNGQRVVGLDNFSTGYRSNIDDALTDAEAATGKSLAENLTLIEGDVTKFDDCINACRGIDYVLHQAALGSVPRSLADPITTDRVNVGGFLNMIRASHQSNVRRFVYASSSSVYGDHPDLPKVEDKVGQPLSPYAITKVVNELYAETFARNFSFQSVGLRYFNVFGKRQDPSGAYAAVIPKWIGAALKGENIYINGDGETSRDFCFIENVVQANVLAAVTSIQDANHQVFNVALNERNTLKELFEAITRKLEVKTNRTTASPVYQEFRPGDVRHSLASIEKAKKQLGYRPSHNLSEGLDESIEWYIAHLSK